MERIFESGMLKIGMFRIGMLNVYVFINMANCHGKDWYKIAKVDTTLSESILAKR